MGDAKSSRRVAASSDDSGRTNGASSGAVAGGPRGGLGMGDIGPYQDARNGSAGGDAASERNGQSAL